MASIFKCGELAPRTGYYMMIRADGRPLPLVMYRFVPAGWTFPPTAGKHQAFVYVGRWLPPAAAAAPAAA